MAPQTTTAPIDPPSTNGNASSLAKGEQVAVRSDDADGPGTDAPPELQSWVDSYVPFGNLLQRLAQHTYQDLTDTLDKMADLQPLQHESQINGLTVLPPTDTSKTSVEKKLALLNFAQRHKDRYIKTLVLAEWGRGMDEMNRLVELTMWLRHQEDLGHLAADAIVTLKQAMMQATMPNPNIQGALEILSSGKASWMPTLGYIPPKPLTAQALLKTFKEIEFILFTRLNLHEDIPPQLHDYSIANGRATFVVPNEFELDVAAADDDTNSPLYCIDLRLLCHTDKVAIPDGPLRHHLESHVNQTLARGGLKAAYDYLHNYILTFLVAQLRSEALELTRGKWHGELNIQLVNRSLILQYWSNNSVPKHWLEVGISSTETGERGKGRHKSPTALSLRWFRNGQEVINHSLGLVLQEFQQLSAGMLLQQAVARHISGRLAEVSRRLSDWARGSTSFEQRLNVSETDTSDCSLTAHVHFSGSMVKLTIEPITGQWAVSPSTMSIHSSGLSSVSQTANTMRYLLIERYLHMLSRQAESIGWTTRTIPTQGPAETHEALRLPRSRSFVSKRLGPDWSLAITSDLCSTEWSLVRTGNGSGTAISAHTLNLLSSTTKDRLPHSAAQLLGLEQYCVAKLSLSILTRELRESSVPFEAHAEGLSTDLLFGASSICSVPARHMLPAGTSTIAKVKPWCLDMIEIRHIGLDSAQSLSTATIHTIAGALAPHVRDHHASILSQKACRESGFILLHNATWRLEVKTPLGGHVLSVIVDRLRAVERLLAYTAAVRRHGFVIQTATLSRFSFRYSQKPPLVAELAAIESDLSSPTCKLRLRVVRDEQTLNPHQRLLDQLEAKLNSDTTIATETDIDAHARHFDELCQALRFTLPVMQTLSSLEAKGPEGRVLFNCHTATSFRLSYRTPLPEYNFAICAKFKGGQCYWLVQERRRRQGQNESVNAKLAEAWSERGAAWLGLRNGAAAQISGIAELLCKLDKIVRSGGESSTQQISTASDHTLAVLP